MTGVTRIQFGPFVVDVRACELRKHGIRLRIRRQPVEILLMLLERPGEVILREEIRQRLWPDNTIVEFEHSINAAVGKLRDALGEAAASPRYIETVPRRGYRFLGSVDHVEREANPAAVSNVDVEPASPPPTIPPSSLPRSLFQRRPSHRLLAIAGFVCLLLTVGWVAMIQPRGKAQRWVLPIGTTEAEVSPNGTAVVWRDADGLWLRQFDAPGARRIFDAAEPVDVPAWSPDGSQVAIVAAGGVHRVRPLDQASSLVCRLPDAPTRGLTWSRNGTLLVATTQNGVGGLYSVPAEGGVPVRLQVPGMTGGTFYHPEFLPDGESFLFAWSPEDDEKTGLYLASLKGDRVTPPSLLRKNMTAAHYSESNGGELLYVESDNLYAQRVVLRGQARLTGRPRKVLDGVYSAGRLRQAYFTVSRNGVLVWTAGRAAAAQLTWFDRRGKALATAGPPGEPEFIRQSPDDRHILIWPRVGPTRIVETARQEELMIPGIGRGFWSPDGSRLIHSGPGEAGSSVMERIVATGETRELFSFPGKVILRDLSADGRALMYQAGEELYFRRLDRLSDPPQRIFHGRTIGRFSPDGNWMLRIQFGKRPQIYLERFPSRSVSAQITPDGGTDPVWRGDGKEILYRSIKTIFSVRVETRGEKLQVSEPQPLFEVKRPPVLGSSQIMAVSSDGSRILFAQATDAIFPPTVYVMTAWAD